MNELLRVLKVLNEMGAMRVRISADGSVDVVFAAPALPQDKRDENAEDEAERRRKQDEDDLYRSAG